MRTPVANRDRASGATQAAQVIPSMTFEEFFREAWPAAFRLAALLTQDRSAAEEIAQETLAQMYAKWGSAEHPHAYLRAAIVHRCHNWRRHAHIERAKLPLVAGAGAVGLGDEELADAVAALPYRQRAVLVLRYWHGLSEAEIAETLRCRPGTVKSLASRALTRLEKVIER